MRVCVVHPGVNWSLSDVYDGLCYGLQVNGVEIVPTRNGADWIIVVNGNLHTPEKLRAWRREAPVAILCTESPYDMDQEIERVSVADAAWTHERVAVPTLQTVNPNVAYLPHAWHPGRHRPTAGDPSVPAHDVVFVGTGFSERVEWLNAIDWTGIDLGIYGLWDGMGLDEHIEARHVKQYITPNDKTVELYQHATLGLNLYRRRGGKMGGPKREISAGSLNPRAYELAACRVFQLSTPRDEVAEKFGGAVPTITGNRAYAKQDEAVIREWLSPAKASDRARCVDLAQRAVASDTWTARAGQVVKDLRAWSPVAA